MKMLRKIDKIYPAEYRPMGDLLTYSPLPTRHLSQIDPFIFLNHHGHQVYPPDNQGLPFGPHPHRGMETVTFIVAGDIMHKDSAGYQSTIRAGGVQWMTAGRGLLHTEVSSEDFKRTGGELEILQMWLNLPAALKMTEPRYIGLQREEIPSIKLSEGATLQLIAGDWAGQQGAIRPLTDIFLSTVEMQQGATWQAEVSPSRNIFLYVVRGAIEVNGVEIRLRQLVGFGTLGEELNITATEDALCIFGHAQPFNEPMVAQGPFVMNTEAEIRQAFLDYHAGRFGVWVE